MKQANELLAKLYQGPTNEQPKHLKGIDPGIWETVWLRLRAAKVMSEHIDSTTSEYWRVSLDGYSHEDLMRGCDSADNWKKSKSDFTVGAFKELCKRPTSHPSHRLFIEDNPGTKLSKEENRILFAELRSNNNLPDR